MNHKIPCSVGILTLNSGKTLARCLESFRTHLKTPPSGVRSDFLDPARREERSVAPALHERQATPRGEEIARTLRDAANFGDSFVAPPRSIAEDTPSSSLRGLAGIDSHRGGRSFEMGSDFAEIIVCDGNSTDDTVAVANRYGAKVIKQYDSDEPNIPCVKDKASVRMRNMAAATCDWYFFMDADDALRPETAEEIRSIVENPHPPFLLYRMPSRIFIDDKLVKYASVYPAYQLRLFNRKTGAFFKGKVHDHVVYDKARYQVGVMKSFYDFRISSERVKNYWQYQKKYTQWEFETLAFDSWASFWRWGVYYRLRIISGFLFWRIPKLYLLHGFKETMPFRYEFLTMWQHVYLLWLVVTHARQLVRKTSTA